MHSISSHGNERVKCVHGTYKQKLMYVTDYYFKMKHIHTNSYHSNNVGKQLESEIIPVKSVLPYQEKPFSNHSTNEIFGFEERKNRIN